MTEYIRIGKLVSTYGLKGELILKHNLGKKTSLKDLKAIFIEQNKETFIPWFIEATRIKTDTEIYLKLEGVDAKEQAIPITQKEVWLPDIDFRKYAAKASPINMLGYELVENDKVLGTVLEIIEQPHQLLCKTLINGKEALIPLNEETLVKIMRPQKKVIVQLPEGLLEIYQ